MLCKNADIYAETLVQFIEAENHVAVEAEFTEEKSVYNGGSMTFSCVRHALFINSS
jgi:hypothetical protein